MSISRQEIPSIIVISVMKVDGFYIYVGQPLADSVNSSPTLVDVHVDIIFVSQVLIESWLSSSYLSCIYI